MARKPGKIRTQRVIVLYSDEEFDKFRRLFACSTSRTFASYVRKVSLEEPVGIVMRNVSFDAFMDEIVVLRKEMSAISRLAQLTPEKQDQLVQVYENIQHSIYKIVDLCMPH